MNIYFTTSARNLKKENHESIYNTIVDLGHQHIDDYKINKNSQKFYDSEDEYKQSVYHKSLAFVKNADLVILEVSTHSLTMGYLIKHAIDLHTPIIALHTKNHSPGFILGIDNECFQLIEYTNANLDQKLKNTIEYLKNLEDVRFNMMISPKTSLYLNEVASKEKISKASYIRNLIKKHQEDDG
jgi:hypothetical protein